MVRRISRPLFLAAGAFFWGNALYLWLTHNWHMGILLEGVGGLILLAWGIWFDTVAGWMRHCWGKALVAFAVAGMVLLSAMVSWLAVYGARTTAQGTEDVLIVLGCGIRGEQVLPSLEKRLQRALDYARQNPSVLIVVTGGQGRGESISEAEAMKRYLVERGIEEARILKEDRSTSTEENFVFTKQLLEARFDGEYTAAVVTNSFHMCRAAERAEEAGLKITHLPASTIWYGAVANYLRECAAHFYRWAGLGS